MPRPTLQGRRIYAGRPMVDMTGLREAARRRFGVDTRALAALREHTRDGENLALVRFEADDERCHRRALREVLLEGVWGVSVQMRDRSRSGAARSSKAPGSRPPRLAVSGNR